MKSQIHSVSELSSKQLDSDNVFHSRIIAEALGHLTFNEQRVFDLLTSQINFSDEPDTMYKISINRILKYLGKSTGGKSYLELQEILRKLFLESLEIITWNGNCKYRHIFSKIDLLKSDQKSKLVTYRFDHDVIPYLFNLKRNFYSVGLNTLRRVTTKNALILLRLWSAYKVPKYQTAVLGSIDEWNHWLRGNLKDKKKWSAATIIQTLKRTLPRLEKEFGNRYVFRIHNFYDGHKIENIQVEIIGDTSTAFPVANLPDDIIDANGLLVNNKNFYDFIRYTRGSQPERNYLLDNFSETEVATLFKERHNKRVNNDYSIDVFS